MKKNIVLLSSFILVGFSMFSFTEAACGSAGDSGLEGILNWAQCILNSTVTPLLVTLAMVGFIWGVISYYLNPDNEEKRKKGKSFIIGGLIALFVIVSMWGLVGILTNTFEGDSNVGIPQLPESSQ